jgi:hypothetical protein
MNVIPMPHRTPRPARAGSAIARVIHVVPAHLNAIREALTERSALMGTDCRALNRAYAAALDDYRNGRSTACAIATGWRVLRGLAPIEHQGNAPKGAA